MFPAQFRRLGERLRQRLPKVGVGIDVGRSAVRVAVLRRGPAGTELLGLASSPVDAQTAAGPAPGVLRDVVRRACRSAYCWPRRVAMAVPANAVVARPVPVDAGAADEEVAEAIERAARQLPVAQADLRLASVPLGPAAVLMVAARREAVLARQHLAARAGIGRVMVDVDLFAVMGAIAPADAGGPAGACVVVDAGLDSVRAVAWAPGLAPVLRVLPVPQTCGSAGLVERIAEAVGGLVPAGMPPASALFLAGGRALDASLTPAVTARTGDPCRCAEPFTGLQDPQGLVLLPDGVAALWPCAIGLARRALA